jgi:hypothetical protein
MDTSRVYIYICIYVILCLRIYCGHLLYIHLYFAYHLSKYTVNVPELRLFPCLSIKRSCMVPVCRLFACLYSHLLHIYLYLVYHLSIYDISCIYTCAQVSRVYTLKNLGQILVSRLFSCLFIIIS